MARPGIKGNPEEPVGLVFSPVVELREANELLAKELEGCRLILAVSVESIETVLSKLLLTPVKVVSNLVDDSPEGVSMIIVPMVFVPCGGRVIVVPTDPEISPKMVVKGPMNDGEDVPLINPFDDDDDDVPPIPGQVPTARRTRLTSEHPLGRSSSNTARTLPPV